MFRDGGPYWVEDKPRCCVSQRQFDTRSPSSSPEKPAGPFPREEGYARPLAVAFSPVQDG